MLRLINMKKFYCFLIKLIDLYKGSIYIYYTNDTHYCTNGKFNGKKKKVLWVEAVHVLLL
jgi:hypothetical protein